MEPDKMTQKKWEVLWYFVQNTADLANNRYGNKCGVKYKIASGEERFYSYPSRIHEDFKESYYPYRNITIAKDWAGKICKDLCEIGILDSKQIRAARQNGKTPHYYLKDGYEPYLKVMKYFFETVTDPMKQRTEMNTYVQNHTDEGLVRYILQKKGAEMRRIIPLTEWDAQEAPKVFKEYFHAENRDGGIPPCSFAEYVQGERSESQFTFPPTISLRLPVFPEGLSKEKQMGAVESLNKQTFERHPWLKQYNSGIREHYDRYEYEHWILPILALIRASPAALNMFLFSDWKPYGLDRDSCCFTESGSSCMEYPLFSLLFEAVRDLAMVRNVEMDRFVNRVSFRPKNVLFPEDTIPALLEIDLENWRAVYYDGSFDTVHDGYGDGFGVVEYPEETNFSFQSWMSIRAFPGGVLFTPDNFPAAFGFLRHLWNTNTLSSHYIYSQLSHEVQNIIATLGDEELTADSQAGRAILKDLNEILLCNDLYRPECFPNLKLTEMGEGRFSRYSHSQLSSNIGLMTSEHFNRELLERAFPEVMPKMNRNEWDTPKYFLEISKDTEK